MKSSTSFFGWVGTLCLNRLILMMFFMCFPLPTCDGVCSQLNYFWQVSVNAHLNYSVVLQITSDTCI